MKVRPISHEAVYAIQLGNLKHDPDLLDVALELEQNSTLKTHDGFNATLSYCSSSGVGCLSIPEESMRTSFSIKA